MSKTPEELYDCPLCGLTIDSVKAPGIIDPWDRDTPLMLRPCTCVVPNQLLRYGRQWATVASENNDTVGVSSGLRTRLEYSGEGLGPIAGDFDQIVMYDSTRPGANEIARYNLADVNRAY